MRRTRLDRCCPGWAERWRRHDVPSVPYSFILADATLSGLCGVFAKTGAMCSAHNLTLHEPYLAAPLLHYLAGLEDSWKVGGTGLQRLRRQIPSCETKRILRQAATQYLPKDVLLQKQKHGFQFPLVQCWQQSTSGLTARDIFKTLIEDTDWFNAAYLDELVQQQASGAANHRYLLLLLAALDQWFRIFIKHNAEAPTWQWRDCF